MRPFLWFALVAYDRTRNKPATIDPDSIAMKHANRALLPDESLHNTRAVACMVGCGSNHPVRVKCASKGIA